MATFQILPRLGLGRWACAECYKTKLFLGWRSTSRNGDPKNDGFVSDGNYIASDFSLVRRSLKNCRYTEKFRDSVVDRLLTGQAHMATIRQELRIRESDLLNWIADRVRRQQEKIGQLNSLLQIIADQKNDARLELYPGDDLSSHPKATVESPASFGSRRPTV